MNKKEITEKVKSFLEQNSYQSFTNHIKQKIIGQDEGVEAMCLQVYKWLISVANNDMKNHNTILTAPSGSGKTAFYHAVKKYLSSLPIPIINFDASSLTPVGYIGNDYTTIFDDMCAVNRECEGVGICFLDEIDKIFVPDTRGSDGVNFHKEAQSCLLKLLEGSEFINRGKDGKNQNGIYMNTANTLFIGMGAFQDIRESRKQSSEKRSVGFTESNKCIAERSIYEAVTDDDIIEFGAQTELIGRFEKVVNYSPISREAVKEIIKRTAKDLLPFNNWKIRIDDYAVAEFLTFIDNNRGIRYIKSKISECIDKVLPEIFENGFNKCYYEIIISSMDNISFSELGQEDIVYVDIPVNSKLSDNVWMPKNVKKKSEQSKLNLSIGEKVSHMKFGKGTVTDIKPDFIEICFEDDVTRKFVNSEDIDKFFV